MQIDDLLHNLRRWGLEVHLSWSCSIKRCDNRCCGKGWTKRIRVVASWIAQSDKLLSCEHAKYNVEEEQSSYDGDHRTDRGDVVSTSVRVRVVGDAAWHTSKT